MSPNPGHLPDAAIGKRVNVRLANGRRFDGWPADGRQGCTWDKRNHPFDIAEFEVAE